MSISNKKNLERNIFRKLRDESLLNDRRDVVENVKIFLSSFYKEQKQNNYIAIYWPLKNEVDLRILKNHFPLALPKCNKNKKLSFHPWDNGNLSEDFQGILSPSKSTSLSYEEISIIFVPCLSVDKNLIRLGYGGGYFDKLREDENWKTIPCIGLLTSNCVSTSPLTKAKWDIPLTGIITEKEILVS